MSDFHTTELRRSLAEQLFGIVAYRIDDKACTSMTAFAQVDLLEQHQLRVKLSNSGYEVVREGRLGDPHVADQVFETLDDLLLAVSPKYSERRAEELMERLSKVAGTPS